MGIAENVRYHFKKIAMDISFWKKFYCGFEISKPWGNNVFSYELRKNKSIFVAPLVRGDITQLKEGAFIVFSEVEQGVEKNYCGLEKFIYLNFGRKNIFIFDNHNHAFFFWLAAFLCGELLPGKKLVHIDQHTDMRKPSQAFPSNLKGKFSLQDVFYYTNFILNVGNFIQPALRLHLFSEVEIIDSSFSFYNPIPENFILDLDMDIFSVDMSYIDYNLKFEKIREYIAKSSFITIASSPYFMKQKQALAIIKRLLI